MTNINMVAPYQGILHWVDTPREGVNQSTGKPWKSVQFALKYLNHQMREEFIVFDLQGVELVNRLLSLPLGTELRVSWRPQARCWSDQHGQTKWFGAFNAFNLRIGPFDRKEGQSTGYAPQGGPGGPASISQPQQQEYIQQPTYQPQSPAPQQPAQPSPDTAPIFPNGETPEDDLPF